MKTKRAVLFIIVILMLVLLAACKRSLAPEGQATIAPGATSQGAGTEATDVLSQIYIFATQTAMANPALQTGIPGEATAVPVQATQPGVSPVAPTAPAQAQPTQPKPAVTLQPVVVATPPPLVVPEVYVLQSGEFPFCIARRFDVNPSALLRVNGLSSYTVYRAGMPLRIPTGAGGFPGNRALMPHPTSYVVRGGETIHTIACAFGSVDPNAIAVVNGLQPPYRLAAGQVLQIP